MLETLAERIAEVAESIESAARAAVRIPAEVRLIAVSKTHPADAIREAISCGVSAFGENKVQEAESKIGEIGRDSAEWHLIGHLQSNKARKAVLLFDVIHSVDSLELAARLERICEEENRDLRVLIQVDLARETTKNGAPEAELAAIAACINGCKRLKLIGLMTLPPFFDDPELARPFFRKLRGLRDEFVPGGELSMGMSHDFAVAIEEGATFVRIGTAIFGEREYYR
jgi:pyridoxal phosphate enzyme (YggS family)